MVETFDQARERHAAQSATGDALAYAAFERGDRLSADERSALTHWSRWGSTGYPVRKLGRKWTIDHCCAPNAPMYPTKFAAVAAWETLIAKWIRLGALEKHAETNQ